MPASPIDSAIYRDLLSDADIAKLFTDSAEVRAMMLVEGALAKVQGELGVIPETAAKAIHRASMELQLDPAALARETGEKGVPVPALVDLFRDLMQAPEHSQYLHLGATSRDIIDTGLALRLRQALTILNDRLERAIAALARLAGLHAETPILEEAIGSDRRATTFGAIAASWGQPLLRHHARLEEIRKDVEVVSFGSAPGALSNTGTRAQDVREHLGAALNLRVPGLAAHADREHVTDLAQWLAGVAGSLGTAGNDIGFMAQSGIVGVPLFTPGQESERSRNASSVAPSLMVAIATQTAALNGAMQAASVLGRQSREAAWFTEWMSLPQMVLLAGRSLALAETVFAGLQPNAEGMSARVERTGEEIFVEAFLTSGRDIARDFAQAASQIVN